MPVNLTNNDISTRYALQEDFDNGFVGRDRQVVIQTDDPKGYRPVIMDGVTQGGKNKVALMDDLTDYVPNSTYNTDKETFATKTELSTKADSSALNNYATKEEVSAKADSTALNNYLPLSGGTITGEILIDGSVEFTNVGYSWENSTGGLIAFRGATYPYNPGGFELFAKNSSAECVLVGKANGDLTWRNSFVWCRADFYSVGAITSGRPSHPALVNVMCKNGSPRITVNGVQIWGTDGYHGEYATGICFFCPANTSWSMSGASVDHVTYTEFRC